MVSTRAVVSGNTIPMVSGRSLTNIRPCSARSGVSATHTANAYLRAAWCASRWLISSEVRGNVASSSGARDCCASAGAAAPAANASNTARRQAARIPASGRWSRFPGDMWFTLFYPFGRGRPLAWGVREHGGAREIEAADQNPRIAVERAGRRGAEAARDDTPGAQRSAESAEPLLPQFVHRAVILAARGKQPLLALEDHGEIGRQSTSGAPFVHRSYAEHQAQAPPIRVPRAGEAHTQPAAVRTRTAVALDLGIAPVEVEVHRAADAGAQITVAGRQAARCGAAGRRGECGTRQRGGKAADAQERKTQASHAGQCSAPPAQAPA